MVRVVEFPLAEGGSVLWEVEDTASGKTYRGAADVVEKATESLEAVMARLKPVVEAVAGGLKGLATRPDTVEVELAIKLSADAGIVVARAGSEASLKIKVGWKPSASALPEQ
jgi:hypothetical protein